MEILKTLSSFQHHHSYNNNNYIFELNKSIKYRSELREGYTTDLQNIVLYVGIRQMFDKSLAASPTLKNLAIPIVFATSYGTDINGYCFQASDGIGIVIEETLSRFSHSIGHIIGDAMFDQIENGYCFNLDEKQFIARIVDNKRNFERLMKITLAYIAFGDPALAYMGPFDNFNQSLRATELSNAMILFAVSHECGHILAKDYEDHWMLGATDIESIRKATNTGEEIFKYRQRKEFAADSHGQSIAVKLYREERLNTLNDCIGPILFLRSIDLIERCLFYVFSEGVVEPLFEGVVTYHNIYRHLPGSHPSAIARIDGLLKELDAEKVPKTVKYFVNKYNGFLEKAYEAFFQKWKIEYRNYSSKKLSVHKRWNVYSDKFHAFQALVDYIKKHDLL